MSLFETYIFSESDGTLARKVQRSIIQKLSIDVYETCYQAMLSDDDKKASTLYHFLQKAFRCGSDILNRLNDPDVFRIFELSRTVGHEAHRYLGFVRFEERNENLLTACSPWPARSRMRASPPRADPRRSASAPRSAG